MRPEELLRHSEALGQRMFSTRGEAAVCQQLVDTMAPLLGAQLGSVTLYRPRQRALTIVATHGYPAVLVEKVCIKPGESVIGDVFVTGAPLIVENMETQQPNRPRRRRYRSSSFLCAPIVGGGTGLGVVSLTDRVDGRPFDSNDLVAIRALTTPVALALAREQMAARVEELSREVMTDALTQAFSHRYFMTHAEQDVQRARRAGSPLTLLMLDIDNFKMINDSMGHPAGDEVLRQVAAILRQTVRLSDVCARLGGEEFAVMMPGSSISGARQIAERIRERIAEQVRLVSVSIGVAELTAEGTLKDLIQRADQALYRAKADGKNRVRVWDAAVDGRPLPRDTRSGT
jgi:diguanylate cyclase (GGDEF)-like protein